MANFNLDNYVPVHERIEKFYGAYPQGRITTDIVQLDDTKVVFKASVFREQDNAEPSAVGHAYEVAGSTYINKTSFIENCETSAVGRALANLGIEVSRGIASREEVQNARAQQLKAVEQPTERELQLQAVRSVYKDLNEAGEKITKESLDAFIAETFGNEYNIENANERQLATIALELEKRLSAKKSKRAGRAA